MRVPFVSDRIAVELFVRYLDQELLDEYDLGFRQCNLNCNVDENICSVINS
jgi:hypothetical protein